MEVHHTIDNTLERLARNTHTPQGKHAASEQTYQELLGRIPAENRPVQMPHTPHRSGFHRWRAACILFVVGIGVALAGVWYQQYYSAAPSSESLSVEGENNSSVKVRTLIYEAAPLSEIVTELSAIYHIPIVVSNSELRDYLITATFSTEESLEEILDILAEIGDFEVLKSSDRYVIE